MAFPTFFELFFRDLAPDYFPYPFPLLYFSFFFRARTFFRLRFVSLFSFLRDIGILVAELLTVTPLKSEAHPPLPHPLFGFPLVMLSIGSNCPTNSPSRFFSSARPREREPFNF